MVKRTIYGHHAWRSNLDPLPTSAEHYPSSFWTRNHIGEPNPKPTPHRCDETHPFTATIQPPNPPSYPRRWNQPTTHTNEISEGREKPSASKKKKNLEEERTKENRRRKRVEDNNVAYSKPLDLLLPHVLHPFKNWREQDIFEWEVSRTLALIVALIWGRRCFVCLCW